MSTYQQKKRQRFKTYMLIENAIYTHRSMHSIHKDTIIWDQKEILYSLRHTYLELAVFSLKLAWSGNPFILFSLIIISQAHVSSSFHFLFPPLPTLLTISLSPHPLTYVSTYSQLEGIQIFQSIRLWQSIMRIFISQTDRSIF